jgi:hypothetical protein
MYETNHTLSTLSTSTAPAVTSALQPHHHASTSTHDELSPHPPSHPCLVHFGTPFSACAAGHCADIPQGDGTAVWGAAVGVCQRTPRGPAECSHTAARPCTAGELAWGTASSLSGGGGSCKCRVTDYSSQG